MQSESMLSDLLKSGLLKDRHDRYKSAGMLSDLLKSGLLKDRYDRYKSMGMLSDLLRSGLLKDRHNINMSAGMLSDLMRSGLPNDNPHLILQTQSESMLSDLLRSELLKDRQNKKYVRGYVERPCEKWTTQRKFTIEYVNTVRKYAERPLEKRAARTPLTPDHHIYSLKTTEYRVYYPVTNIAIYFIEIYILYTSTTLLREFEFGEIRATVVIVGSIVH